MKGCQLISTRLFPAFLLHTKAVNKVQLVLLCPIGEQFPLSSFREFVHDGNCLATLARFVHQGKLLFSTFLTRNEGTTDESKKRLGCYQQEQVNLPGEYSVFDSSQCIVNNKKIKMRRRRESQISKTTTLHVHHTFLYISLPSTARLPVKMPNFMFCEGRKQAMTKFIIFMDLDMLIEIQPQKSSLAFDKVSELE